MPLVRDRPGRGNPPTGRAYTPPDTSVPPAMRLTITCLSAMTGHGLPWSGTCTPQSADRTIARPPALPAHGRPGLPDDAARSAGTDWRVIVRPGASRVLPHPPGPVNVTTRRCAGPPGSRRSAVRVPPASSPRRATRSAARARVSSAPGASAASRRAYRRDCARPPQPALLTVSDSRRNVSYAIGDSA
jgi:hypothetical protein